MAEVAENSGWDGLFIWDHLGWVGGIPCGDPWISLTAAAAATTTIGLGFDVTPLPRRRPQVVATAATALDRFSNGRLILGVGLGGVPAEYEAFGETSDPKLRAAMLDEALTVITRLWTGRRVDHRGRFYTAADVALAPLPVQQPRPPVWVGGRSRPALGRAAAWDGYAAGTVDDERGNTIVEPAELKRRLEIIGRAGDDSFDVAVVGTSEPTEQGKRQAYAAAGATWWLESIHDLRGPLDTMLDRVRHGP